MTKRSVLTIMVIIVVAARGVAQAPPHEGVRGHVATKTGKSVSGVKIEGSETTCCPVKPEKTTTDETGYFKLTHPGQVVYFRREGFRPLSYVLEPGENEMKAVLEDAKESNWIFPACPIVKEKGKREGKYFRFLILKGTRMKKGFDVDYAYFHVISDHDRGVLSILSGPWASGGGGPAPADWIVNSSLVEERWIAGSEGGFAGIDSRGRLMNGRKWRRISTAIYDSASYYDVSEESAANFDRVLDSLCFAEPKP